MTDIQAALDAAVTAERARIREKFREYGESWVGVDEAIDIVDDKSEPLTHTDIKGMTREQINAKWPEVQKALSRDDASAGYDPAEPITREQLEAMPRSEQLRRKVEIDAFLSGGTDDAA